MTRLTPQRKASEVQKHTHHFALTSLMVVSLVLFATFAVVQETGLDLSGLVTQQTVYDVPLVVSVEDTMTLPVRFHGTPTSVHLSGRILGAGDVRAVLRAGNSAYLLYDSSVAARNRLTGYVALNDSYSNMTARAANVTQNNTNASGESGEEEPAGPREPPAEPETIKTIDAVLTYASGSAWDTHDNGIEPTGNVIDVTLNESMFTFGPDTSKLCTKWTITNSKNADEYVCAGNVACCSFLGMETAPGLLYHSFTVYDGLYGADSESRVTAQIVYYDVNLNLSDLRTDIIYSDPVSLPVTWVPLQEVQLVDDVCSETCALNEQVDDAEIVITASGDAVFELLGYSYSVVEYRAPRYVGPENITFFMDTVYSADVTDWFTCAENTTLLYRVIDDTNLNITLDGSNLTIQPDAHFSGQREIVLIAEDGDKRRKQRIAVVVENTNNAVIELRDNFGALVHEGVTRLGRVTLAQQRTKSKGSFFGTASHTAAAKDVTDTIALTGVRTKGTVTGYLDTLHTATSRIEQKLATQVIALPELDFDSAIVSLAANRTITTLVTCPDFDFVTKTCPEWVPAAIPFIQNETHITFNVTHFSAYAGADINIINVQSYPSVGGYWTVRFNTTGAANLTITPVATTTFTEYPVDDTNTTDDLTFVDVRCGNVSRNVTYVMNATRIVAVVVKNYSCDYEGSEISRVWTSGKHDLQFMFGDDVSYAHNDASVTDCTEISTAGQHNLTQAVSSDDSCIAITASNVNFNCQGLQITYGGTGEGYGVNVTGAITNVTVRNCVITKGAGGGNNNYGISVKNADQVNLINNTITTDGVDYNYGVYFYGSDNGNISFNTISSSGSDDYNSGIYLEDSDNCNISNNSIETDGDQYNHGVQMDWQTEGLDVVYNSIYTTGNAYNYGIKGYPVSTLPYFAFNNITSAGVWGSYGIKPSGGATIQGNIIITSGSNGGLNYGVYEDSNAGVMTVIDNIINTSGTNGDSTAWKNHGVIIGGGTGAVNVSNNKITIDADGNTNYGVEFINKDGDTYSLVIQNNEISVSGTYSGYGIYIPSTTDDVKIYDNVIITNGTSTYNYGIYLSGTNENDLRNNTISTDGSGRCYGIRFYGSYSNNLYNTTVSTDGENSAGFTIYGNSHSNNITSFNIETQGTGAHAILFNNSGADEPYNNYLYDGKLSSLSGNDLWYRLENVASNNYFYNVTFDESELEVFGAPSGQLHVYWWTRGYVEYASSGVDAATVTAEDVLGNTDWTQTTDATGYTSYSEVREYIRNNTGKFYDTNYTFNATYSTFSPVSYPFNVTASSTINLTLSRCTGTEPPLNGDWIIADSTSCEGVDITLNGNITIEEDANLSLSGVTLIMNTTGPVNRTINVSGYFNFSNTNISSTNSSEQSKENYRFFVMPRGRIFAEHSFIYHAGDGSGIASTYYGRGLTIQGNHSNINNVSIIPVNETNRYGVYVYTAYNTTLTNVTVETKGSSSRALYIIHSNRTEVVNCSFATWDGTSDVIELDTSHNVTIKNSRITTHNINSFGLSSVASNRSILVDNTFSIGGRYGEAIDMGSVYACNISRNTFDITGSNVYGVLLSSSHNNRLYENNYTISGSDGYGLYLYASTNNTIRSENIDMQGSTSHGLYFTGASVDNNVSHVNITTNGSNAFAVNVEHSGANSPTNNTIYNSFLNSHNASDIRLNASQQNMYLYVVNVSFNQSNVTFGATPSGVLDVAWWTRAFVNTSALAALESATVRVYASNASQEWNEETTADGFTTWRATTVYVEDDTGRTELAPYEYRSYASGYSTKIEQNINFSSDRTVNFTMEVCYGQDPPTGKGNWSINWTTTCRDITIRLYGNLTIDDDANLSLHNVTLIFNTTDMNRAIYNDGNLYINRSNLTVVDASDSSTEAFHFITTSGGYLELRDSYVYHAGDGSGSAWNYHGRGVNIQYADNCIITNNTIRTANVQYGYGIYTRDADNTEIRDNKVTTVASTSYAIRLYDGTNSVIENNEVVTSAIYGHGIRLTSSSYGNIVANNSVSTNGESAYGIYLDECSARNDVLNNNITTTGQYGYGIRMPGTQNQVAESNTIRVAGDDTHGIYGSDLTDNATLKNNTITNVKDGYGIGWLNSTNSSFIANTIVTNDTSDYGIYLYVALNNSIENNSITTNGTYGYGIRLDDGSMYNVMMNNSIWTNGSIAPAVYFYNASYNRIEKGQHVTKGSSGYGVYFRSTSEYNNVSNLRITTQGQYGHGIRFNNVTEAQPSSNYVMDTVVTVSDGYDVWYGTYNQTPVNYLVNVSFDETNINFDGTNGKLDVGWWVRTFVNASDGPVENANVTALDNESVVEWNVVTNALGYTAWLPTTEYTENSTGKFFRMNYTINASESATGYAEQSVNISDCMQINLTLTDSDNPSVDERIPAPDSSFNRSQTIEIGVNVTDEYGISVVYANVTYPNGTIRNASLSLVAGTDKYNASYSLPDLTGLYNVTYYANDSSGNVNVTTVTNFTVNNRVANLSAVVLTSSNGMNLTNENLTLSYSASDADTDAVKNITNWYLNGSSFIVLNMPFEGGSVSGNETGIPNATRDYALGNNGTVVNATWNATGGYDGFGAYEFDGSGDYMNLGTEKIDNSETGTFVAWVKVDSNTDIAMKIFNYGETQDVADPIILGFEIRTHASCGSEMRVGIVQQTSGGTVAGIAGSTELVEDTWYHLAVVSDGSQYTYYVNGVKESSTCAWSGTNNGNWFADTIPTGSTETAIGGGYYDSDAPAGFLNGTIDDFRYYNRSLTAEQIYALYTNRTDRIVLNETNIDETWHACVTPNDGIEDGTTACSNNLTITNTKPAVINITGITTEPVYENQVRKLNFSVIVEDNSSVSDIETVNLTITSPIGVTRINDSCTLRASVSSVRGNYSCAVDLAWFDTPGTWTVNATAVDAQGEVAVYLAETFTVQSVMSIELGPDNITWAQLTPGVWNQTAVTALLINNTGNANITPGSFSANATDLVGQDDATFYIPAFNFSIGPNTAGDAECGLNTTANQTVNNTEIYVGWANLSRGNYTLADGTGQEELYICLRQVPSTMNGVAFKPQSYVATREWVITAH